MNDLTGFIKDELLCHGADLVGIGDLRELPAEVRDGLPIGICVTVKHKKDTCTSLRHYG